MNSNILIVDDTPASLKLLTETLASEGFRVRPLNNGELALRSAGMEPPELILLDVRMPGLDGFEVCRRLKEDAMLRPIPVIFISAAADVEDKLAAFQAGGVDYITKPFRREEVLARATTHIELYRSRRELARLNQALIEANEKLTRLSETDGLLGIANRPCFDRVLEREWNGHMRSGTPLSLAMIDVDHFKLYNDTYGHLAGDACLKTVAEKVRTVLRRSTDLVARYGGEEVVVVMPDTPLEGAMNIARDIQSRFIDEPIPDSAVDRGFVTVSIGVAMRLPESGSLPSSLVAAADRALYAAKEAGRNCIRHE
ncbi:MAG TPA: diguanylate cyclase [Syntrophorhabdaceae bacterium]|jgi:diguanylate cyclase (GGDEF)-like protein